MWLPRQVPTPLQECEAYQILNQSVDFPLRPPIFNHMVELQTPQMNSVFHALGDATRRHMLRDLAGGERTVGQLAEPFAISLAAASSTLMCLEAAASEIANGSAS